MDFSQFRGYAARHRSFIALLTLLTTFAGVALILDRPKGPGLELVGIPLIIFGGAGFMWVVWPAEARTLEVNATLVDRFMQWLTPNGGLVRFFPAIGVGLVLADLAYNLTISATPALQSEDSIVLLAAAVLLAYGRVPRR